MEHLAQIIMVLAIAVAVIVIMQRLHLPTNLGYLLVGVILGPHTTGPILDLPEFASLAEFGVVFLLFTMGLNYSLPQLLALRHQVAGSGTGQVLLTTIIVGLLVWLSGLPVAVAFVIGAVFAQSSSTIIASQLREQGEDSSLHGRLGLAMSVFQDVTAVPFLIIIPVLGAAAGAGVLAAELGWALTKAVFAFALVFFAGRWLLRPLFCQVAMRRSAELFTLAVLLVVLLAAWTTGVFGLSLAFGAFLAGMMLGDTEFRHQVESSIRPFRDVLLGLFFIGIGMLFDPAVIVGIWYWSLSGALLILLSKALIVVLLVRRSGVELLVAWRTALLLAIGGEFGFALLAIALNAGVIDEITGQIALVSILFSMIAGAFLIRFNQGIASRLAAIHQKDMHSEAETLPEIEQGIVIVGGYGRVGHTVAVLLQNCGVPFVVFDIDLARVAQGRAEKHPVMYGDISDPEFLITAHAERAALLIITVDQSATALHTVAFIRRRCPHVPVIARARDIKESSLLLAAGATHAYPEAIEASLHLGETALRMLQVPVETIEATVQGVRDWDYKPVLEDNKKLQDHC